jgi:stearoyl-CoA desaturase (delta-9 desaturase)
VNILIHGLLGLSWSAALLLMLGLTHITILTVTLYLHRSCAHRSIEFPLWLTLFFRTWAWLTTGMTARQWASVHRKHHAKCETLEDPHSPQQRGLAVVLFKGVALYRDAARDPEVVKRYGAGTPNDRLENFFEQYAWLGMIIMIAIELPLLGIPQTMFVATLQLLWIPFWAAGVINGVGHFWGYRNHESDDASRNISPWGILIGGEELHNNHHAFPSSAKLSFKPWEFDWGWAVLQTLSFFGMAKIKRTVPKAHTYGTTEITIDTLRALAACRFQAMGEARRLLTPIIKQQLNSIPSAASFSHRTFLSWFFFDYEAKTTPLEVHKDFQKLLAESPILAQLRHTLSELVDTWKKAHAGAQETLEHFKTWCHAAETSGVEALSNLASTLRTYRLAHA